MGIEFQVFGAAIAPVIICDVCKERIKDAKLANILYDGSLNHFKGPFKHIIFAHKDCSNVNAEIRMLAWDDLDSFLVQVVHNTGMDYEAALKRENEHVEMGISFLSYSDVKE